MAIRRETDADQRRREIADSLEYAARSTRDPELARRAAQLAADMAAGGLSEEDELRYEGVMARLSTLEQS